MLTLRNFVFGAAIAVVGASAFVQTAPASAATPVFDQRQHHQDRRIDQGVASGALTKPEARRPDRQQDAIERAEDKVKADGVVTPSRAQAPCKDAKPQQQGHTPPQAPRSRAP